MNILRKLGLGVSVLLFSLGISLFAAFISLHFAFNTSQPLKQSLQNAGIYKALAESAVEQQKEDLPTSLATTDPGVRQALAKALTPAFLQNSVEQVIDSTYNWVQGRTSMLDFSIDLSPVKVSFADSIAVYIQQKLADLPPCTRQVTPPATTEELLALSCMPRGMTPASIASNVRQEAINSQLFTEGATINASTLKDAEGVPLTDKLAFAPKAYQYYLMLLYILPVIILLSAVAVVFWSATKRIGAKRLAKLLISTGISNALFVTVGLWLLHTASSIFGIPSVPAALQDAFLAVIENLVRALQPWWLGFAGGYIVIGIVIFIVLKANPPKATLVMGSEHSHATPFLEKSTVKTDKPGEPK